MLRCERVDERADHVVVPLLERADLLGDVALVPGFVGGLDVEEEEVTVVERREGGVALRRRSRCRTRQWRRARRRPRSR